MKPGRSRRRVYEELRAIVERAGGAMYHERAGHPAGGAWIVEIDGKRKVFEADGREYMALARLYVPKPGQANPTTASHYTNDLVDGADAKWLSMIRR